MGFGPNFGLVSGVDQIVTRIGPNFYSNSVWNFRLSLLKVRVTKDFCRDFDLCKVLTVVEVSGSSCSVTGFLELHIECVQLLC